MEEFFDDYEHNSTNLIYFPQNVPTEDVIKQYHSQLNGCNCVGSCNAINKCECIEKSGVSYSYDNLTNLTSYKIVEINENKPAYECNDNCSCSNILCGNKLTQYGPRKNLCVKQCKRKGFGLFTSKKILSNFFICEYAGELISENDAKERFKRYTTKMNYVFCLKEHFGEKIQKLFIDPTNYGNIGRYINHSCSPNSKLFIIRHNSTLPTLCVFSKGNIEANCEITMDYGSTNSNKNDLLTRCLCNSENCRGYLPFDMELTN